MAIGESGEEGESGRGEADTDGKNKNPAYVLVRQLQEAQTKMASCFIL